MAVELCSETSSSCVAAMSPRISFSHDLSHQTAADGVPPIEQYIRSNSSSSSVDFDFCVFRESFDQEYSSSADELFFDGKILPIEIKKKLGGAPTKSSWSSSSPSPPPPPPPPPPLQLDIDFHHSSSGGGTTRKSNKDEKPREQNSNSNITDSAEKQNSSSNKSWFKRSSSLNCGSGYARSLCPIPLLSRSNSTGSTPNVKRSSSSTLKEKDYNINYNYLSNNNKQKFHHQKPPLKKSYTTPPPPYGNGNGVKVNPVLNVPTPSLFGLASIFSTSKDKNKKK